MTPAHTHDGEAINYTRNGDGTHTGVYACGVTAVTNEACADGNDADNLCDKCGRDLTPACTHENEVITDYTSNGDGTHNVTYACGATVENLSCSDGEENDGVCNVCGYVNDTFFEYTTYDVNDWLEHWGGTARLTVSGNSISVDKSDNNGDEPDGTANSPYTIGLTTVKDKVFKAGKTYIITSDMTYDTPGSGNRESITLEAKLVSGINFDDVNFDRTTLIALGSKEVAFEATETVTFTYTPTVDTTSLTLAYREETWEGTGSNFSVSNIKIVESID